MTTDPIAQRRAAHEREQLSKRRWTIAVGVTALSLLLSYVCLLIVVRVMDPFYLVLNFLATATGLCNVIVYRVYELPTILAELPRLAEPERRINLAAIEPIRAELLERALRAVGLARTNEEAAALDDDELVRRLSTLERPDWSKIGRNCLIAYLIVASATLALVASYRPENGSSLLDLAQGKSAPLDRRWSPL